MWKDAAHRVVQHVLAAYPHAVLARRARIAPVALTISVLVLDVKLARAARGACTTCATVS